MTFKNFPKVKRDKALMKSIEHYTSNFSNLPQLRPAE